MNKNLMPKIVLIIVLVALAAWTLYPPGKTLKPGIDVGGGVSLIYEIDTQDLEKEETKDLAQRMITVLRRRIDPANIQNLVWRPQGNTRFEIQMPLSSAEAHAKRQKYEQALSELLAKNTSTAKIMRSLKKPQEERIKDFNDFAQSDPNRIAILGTLATCYDELKEKQDERDELEAQLKIPENLINLANLDLDEIKLNLGDWIKVDAEQLTESLKEYLGSETNLDLLTRYVKMYGEWAKVADELTDPETGKNIRYEKAKKDLDKLNLTEDQINFVLQLPAKSSRRTFVIEELKSKFADRATEIDNVVAAFDEYRPFRGRLDDPKDLQRMLKGAGILEFRILPTQGHPEVDMAAMAQYAETLKEKGPKYASDNKFIWCEIENVNDWGAADDQKRPSIVGQFGDKYYVLASNNKDEVMLHRGEGKSWKLKRASAGREPRTGRRAIDFVLDDRGGKIFGKITGNNIGRPLCILLDGVAISAPSINSRITTHGQITGQYSEDQQRDMVDKLNAGSLPARLIEQPISVKTIGPSIGADNRNQGIKAGLIGLIVVMACMLIYYTLAGSIADMALFINILFVLAIMAGVKATFTLPGIAGIILTIGMSVDANVLIFERIREEQQRGSSLRIAIANGYQRAFRTIFDANLTTFITAAILYWVASEEVKGFALVLMLGIASSMFTALFVTRVIFDFLLALRSGKFKSSKVKTWTGFTLAELVLGFVTYLISNSLSITFVVLLVVPCLSWLLRDLVRRTMTDHLFMLRLIHKPNVNWMRARPIFLTMSAVLIAAGSFVFFTRDDAKNNKYDIEFTGGTSAVINLKEAASLSRSDVEDRIHKIGEKLNNPALLTANVYSIGKTGKQYEINTTETNKSKTIVKFSGGEPRSSEGLGEQHTAETVTSAIEKAQDKFVRKLNNLLVTQNAQAGAEFTITTSQMNQTLVKNVLTDAFPNAQISEPEIDEVVNNAILAAFADELEIQQNLQPTIISQEKLTEELVDAYPELTDFTGGIKILCEIKRAATKAEIEARLASLQFKPDTQDLPRYDYVILGPKLATIEQNKPVNQFAYISVVPEAGLRELTEDEWTQFVENETTKVLAAVKLETSLPRVTQIDPSVGEEQKTRALIAIILSLFAIVTYIWIRFGNVRYGIAAIIALVHDVCITLGAVTACTYIAASPIGEKLLIGDFKINLAMIAAFLTLIGYSLNDTIVVFDRIRENRKRAQLNPKIISDSINQTISRTILTSFTTFIVVLIMYIFGGQALRGFTFAIGLGVIIGTYSSIAIAAPILLLGARAKNEKSKSR